MASAKTAAPATETPESAPADGNTLYIPTTDEIKSALWEIATGAGSEASRVSALRALADITGMLKPRTNELPEALTRLLDGISQGYGRKSASQKRRAGSRHGESDKLQYSNQQDR